MLFPHYALCEVEFCLLHCEIELFVNEECLGCVLGSISMLNLLLDHLFEEEQTDAGGFIYLVIS